MPQRFKHADGNGIAEIQAARLLPDGDADAVIIMGLEERLRQALRLPAEEQVAPVVIGDIAVGARRLCREQPLLDNVVFRIEVLEIVVYAHIDQMPVIQPGAAHGPLGDIEAQRPDEMQHGAGCGAGAGNIAGVLRDLRRNKDNVQHGAPAEKRFSRQHALQNTADQYSMTNDPKIQLFFLNFQK